MAYGLFRHRFADHKDISIEAAGIHALVGQPPEDYAQLVMQERKGIDISDYRAKQSTHKLLLNSDVIFVMEQQQKKEIEFQLPVICGRVLRLGQWNDFDIPDPYRRSKIAFEQTYFLIEKCLDYWQNHL